MLKVLYLPLGEQAGMQNAFREVGVNLSVFNFWGEWERTKSHENINRIFLDRVKEFQPDLISMQLQLTGCLNKNVLEEAKKICPGVIIVNWTGDVRDTASGHFAEISQAIDYSLISSTGQIDLFQRAGCRNVKYWQIGYDPQIHKPLNYTSFKYDVSFLGNNYGSSFPDANIRTQASKEIISKYKDRAGIFGSGYSPSRESASIEYGNEIYNQSICTLSISHYNNIAHYFSDRLLHCLASGRPTISWNFPNYDSYFVDGSEIFMVKSVKELIEAVEYCKANPDIAKQVGVNGQLRAAREHTFTARVVELLNLTNLIGKV